MAQKRQGPLAHNDDPIKVIPEKLPEPRKLRIHTATAIARRYVAEMKELPANTFLRTRSYLKAHRAHVFVAKYRNPATREELSLMTFWVKDDRQVVLIEYLHQPKQLMPNNGHIFRSDTVQPRV